MAISTKKLAMAGAGAAVLGLGIAIPAVAFAQDPSPSPSSSAPATAPGDADREQRHAERQDRMAELLANELGIDKAKVTEALTKVDEQMRTEMKAEHQAALSARLAEAVAAGKLTQAEADAILKAAEAGVLPGGHGHPGRPGR
jgi:hypothetical protein